MKVKMRKGFILLYVFVVVEGCDNIIRNNSKIYNDFQDDGEYWVNTVLSGNFQEFNSTGAYDLLSKNSTLKILHNMDTMNHQQLETNLSYSSGTNHFIQKCPPGLNYVELYSIPFCYVLTDKQSFPPICPYENYLEYETITSIYNNFKDKALWARAKRNTDDGFGQFEVLTPTPHFLDIIENYEPAFDTIKDKNCMIRQNGKLTPVKCTDAYPILCIYSYVAASVEKFCTKRSSYQHCVSTNLNLDNKCYCQSTANGMSILRKDFCKKFAEPREPFQNNIILSQLSSKSPCWFGVEQHNGEFQWSSSKTSLGYSYWREDINTTKNWGVLNFSNPQGWGLEIDDGKITCGVCEVEVDYRIVSIHLKYNSNESKLLIRVDNVADLHNYFMLHYVLSCFTDANTNDLIEKKISSITDVFLDPKTYTRSIKITNNYPSYYWCVSLQRPSLLRVFSNKLLIYQNDGKHNHEYSLTVSVGVPKSTDPFLAELHVLPAKFIAKKLESTYIINVVRPMRVLSFSESKHEIELVLHLSTLKHSLTDEEEYTLLLEILESLPNDRDSHIFRIGNFLRSDVCLPNLTWSKNKNTFLSWPEIPIGTYTTPKELCLQHNFIPVVRKCAGNFLTGGVWLEVQGDCANITVTNRTQTLHDLLYAENMTTYELAQNLSQITLHSDEMLTIDVHLIAGALQRLLQLGEIKVEDILTTFSNVMNFNHSTLEEAQSILNSTDRTLHSLDTILERATLFSEVGSMEYATENLIIHMHDLRLSNITGFVINRLDKNSNYEAMSLRGDIDVVSLRDMEVAIILQPEYTKKLFECATKSDAPIKIVFTFFENEVLFNEVSEEKQESNSRVISVFASELDCEITPSLKILFRPQSQDSGSKCGYWKYGSTELTKNIYGHWEDDSTSSPINNSDYVMCEFSHTTHFALLMLNGLSKDNFITLETTIALNIITAIGCFLSLFGIGAIFVTAVFFRTWRVRSRNIIMLNFSASLAAQMILLFIADNARDDSTLCLISGALLHYTVLAEFAWMLMVAILQYRKFVIVFQSPISFLVIKCMVVGWCFPLIPVIAFLMVYPKSYKSNMYGICYPAAEYFFIGIALPISTIVVINTFIFVKIFISICNKKVEAYGANDNEMKIQVLLAILLFFLLGMSWLFGLGAAFDMHVTFSYLFCLTATLQGFVIFMYFVVLNKNSHVMWFTVKKFLFCAERYQRQIK